VDGGAPDEPDAEKRHLREGEPDLDREIGRTLEEVGARPRAWRNSGSPSLAGSTRSHRHSGAAEAIRPRSAVRLERRNRAVREPRADIMLDGDKETLVLGG